jgi:hypothetical protein
VINPLFLRYGYLNSLRLGRREETLFHHILSYAPFCCPLHVSTSSLTRHSLRCYHLSRCFSFPDTVAIASLFHNIYGTNFLNNSKIACFIVPSLFNRNHIRYHLGFTAESVVHDYSRLNCDLLSSAKLSELPPEILSLIFINTIEIASSIYSFSEVRHRAKLSFYLPVLSSICDLASSWSGYPSPYQLLFAVESLSSLLSSSDH